MWCLVCTKSKNRKHIIEQTLIAYICWHAEVPYVLLGNMICVNTYCPNRSSWNENAAEKHASVSILKINNYNLPTLHHSYVRKKKIKWSRWANRKRGLIRLSATVQSFLTETSIQCGWHLTILCLLPWMSKFVIAVTLVNMLHVLPKIVWICVDLIQ